MKGYAILLIMGHNYVDHILGMGNNEMAFSATATADFVSQIFHHPSVWHILSFMGWIGVALFLFASGYGLTSKYRDQAIHYGEYIKRYIVKLWVLLVPIYILYIVVQHWCFGESLNWQSVVAQLTFSINILSYGNNAFTIEPGVYWFFGAILQFYLLFPLLHRWRMRWLVAALVGAVALHYGFLYLSSDNTMWWFRQNSIGWGAPFLLGIIAAKSSWQPSKGVLVAICLLSLALLSLSLVVKAMMPLTEVCTVAFIGSITLLVNIKPINAVGDISASIFVIHPFVRMILYETLDDSALGLTAMVAIYVAVVAVLSIAHYQLYRRHVMLIK